MKLLNEYKWMCGAFLSAVFFLFAPYIYTNYRVDSVIVRIDRLEDSMTSRFSARIDRLEDNINSRFSSLDAKRECECHLTSK